MTKRASFTAADLARAAKVARDAGVSVTLESADGQRVIVSPFATPAESPQDDAFGNWKARRGESHA